MKFTTYESAVNPTVGNPPALRANGAGGVHVINTNPTAGQGLGGLAAGIGQMTKVAQKMQDDQDTADYMAARAQASQAVLDGLYGPDGMFSTRLGVNAKGLTADTVKLIRDSYADIAKDKNWKLGEVRGALSDYYIQNASFLKCDNITLGYSFDNLFGLKASGRVYATAQNVFTITKYKGLDPEIDGGYDGNIYPRPFVGILGLNLNF
jgi:hypothetical protein